MSYQLVTEQQQLLDCCQQLAGSAFLALDTEFLRESTYYPKLALIQVANETSTFIIDPLVLDDLGPFLELINQPAITKVLHSARQDYEIFYNLQDKLPQPIFDTQIAASLLGYGEQIGYANLIKSLLDIDVDKSQTRTDWTRRPLNNKQLDYAASDVIHLAAIYPMMRDQLIKLDRLDWLDDDFSLLTDPASYQADKRAMWKKIKSANRLPARKLSIVQELADWREQQAIEQNLTRKRVLSDDVIVDIANQQPETIEELQRVRQINPRLNTTQLNDLLTCIKTGLDKQEDQWPRFKRTQKPNGEQSATVDILSAILTIRAAENNISPAFICNRKDLVKLVMGDTDSLLYRGWRNELVGDSIRQFLSGDSAIRYQGNKLVIN